MNRLCRITSVVLLLLSGSWNTGAGQTNLSGVINIYTQVTAVNVPSNYVTVASTAGFAIGDTVLLIQMQGATIDASNSASFGNITAIGNAGNYELAIICNIVGNDVTFDQTLSQTYSNNAVDGVQMVSFPNYGDVNINGALTAQAWNGTTGGVLAFKSTGTVTFNANINVAGLGFSGGAVSINSGSSCTSDANYFLAAGNANSGYKGHGIADIIATKEEGRGKQANGGGAGNNHNCGGGGGANYAAGGNGGNHSSGCSVLNSQQPGIAGSSLGGFYPSNKIFMGGGGGAGQQNNSGAGPGANGGGIVILVANSINGNGNSIVASGNNGVMVFQDQEDGGGGGGGGGAVLISCPSLTSALTVDVKGGNGGNTSSVGGPPGTRNLGPGGGGGGGVLWVSNGSLDPFITLFAAGGNPGTSEVCACAFGAVSGSSGGSRLSLSIPMSAIDYAGCNLGPLPARMVVFTGAQNQSTIELNWITASEQNSDFFEVQRSVQGNTFEVLGTVAASGNTTQQKTYSFTDFSPFEGSQFYRIRQVDRNGTFIYSAVIEVSFHRERKLVSAVYPNPVDGGGSIFVALMNPAGDAINARLIDGTGRLVKSWNIEPEAHNAELNLSAIAPGLYFLEIRSGSIADLVKVVISNDK